MFISALLMFLSTWLMLVLPPIVAYIIARILGFSENWQMITMVGGIVFAISQFNANMQHLHRFVKNLAGNDDSELLSVDEIWRIYHLGYRFLRFFGVFVVLFSLIATGWTTSLLTAFGANKPLAGLSGIGAIVFAVMYELNIMRNAEVAKEKPDIVLGARIIELLIIIGVAVAFVAPLQHLYSVGFVYLFGLKYLAWHNYLLLPLLFFSYILALSIFNDDARAFIEELAESTPKAIEQDEEWEEEGNPILYYIGWGVFVSAIIAGFFVENTSPPSLGMIAVIYFLFFGLAVYAVKLAGKRLYNRKGDFLVNGASCFMFFVPFAFVFWINRIINLLN